MSEEEKQTIAETINSMVAKTLQLYMAGFVVLIVLIFGWHSFALKNNAEKISEVHEEVIEMSRDFGEVNQTLRKAYPDELVFESNYMKYVIKRGGTK
jgi:predicted negative regulator of RcsB-dependent stress response